MSGRKPRKRVSDVSAASRGPKVSRKSLVDRNHVDSGPVATVRHPVRPGSVLVMGEGVSGQLGLGPDIPEKTRPAAVPGLDKIIEVAAGGMHTICLTDKYEIISFGCNDEGALGRDTSEEGSESQPGRVELLGKVVQISAGDSHTAALLEDGTVYVWGTFRDNHGSMGLMSKNNLEKTPVRLDTALRFKKIASGSHHLVLLGTNGNVYTAGCAEQGQLGRLSERTSSRDSRFGITQMLKLSSIRVGARYGSSFVDVWAGSYNTMALDRDGNVHVWGLNNYKQLGVEKENLFFHPVMSKSFEDIPCIKISGGDHHTLALSSDGKVYSLGRKEYGRLGLGPDCSDAEVPTLVEIADGVKCVDISCGSSASFALTEEGKLFAWGMGAAMLGLGDEDDVFKPTLVKGKQLENRKIIRVEGAGQHTVLLAI